MNVCPVCGEDDKSLLFKDFTSEGNLGCITCILKERKSNLTPVRLESHETRFLFNISQMCIGKGLRVSIDEWGVIKISFGESENKKKVNEEKTKQIWKEYK